MCVGTWWNIYMHRYIYIYIYFKPTDGRWRQCSAKYHIPQSSYIMYIPTYRNEKPRIYMPIYLFTNYYYFIQRYIHTLFFIYLFFVLSGKCGCERYSHSAYVPLRHPYNNMTFMYIPIDKINWGNKIFRIFCIQKLFNVIHAYLQ